MNLTSANSLWSHYQAFDLAVLLLAGLLAVVAVVWIGGLVATLFTVPNLVRLSENQLRHLGMHTVDVGEGEALFSPTHSTNRAVLVVHGHNRSKEWMLPFAVHLVGHANVLVIDLPAHGSQWPGICTFGGAEALYIAEALDWLHDQGFEDVLVVGHSMGGSSAMHAVGVFEPENVDGVATINSYVSIDVVYDDIADRFHVPRWFTRSLLGAAGVIAGRLHTRGRSVVHHDHTLPTLLLQSPEDTLVRPHNAERAAFELQPAAVQRRDIAGGHDDFRNRAVAAEVLRFMRQLDDEADNRTLH